MEYCPNCLEGRCSYHKWFTDLKLKNEKEILIADLSRIIEINIIGIVVEKIYQVHSHLNYGKDSYIIDYIHGNLNFTVNTPPSGLKDGYYMPLNSYGSQDQVINYDIEIIVDIIRHNPMYIKVNNSIFDNKLIYEIPLLDSNDYLHMESIDDYHKIVDIANSRLGIFVKKLRQLYENENKNE